VSDFFLFPVIVLMSIIIGLLCVKLGVQRTSIMLGVFIVLGTCKCLFVSHFRMALYCSLELFVSYFSPFNEQYHHRLPLHVLIRHQLVPIYA